MTKCKYVKREGESCTLNNNCTYPDCPVEEKMYTKEEILEKLTVESLRKKFHSQSNMFINKQTSSAIIDWIEENL